ncbi:2-dehydro-3-deoxygalactonokinase [Sphingomonas sp.]|uniref:2-dehydro-3-deoxygalactonokinase n=1 Tax=Sphingomonas sp. TaxID=28214 RepID=UPI0035C7926E
MTRGAYIAVDWGTTNRRAWLVDARGAVLDQRRDERGVLSIVPGSYPREIADLRRALGDVPVFAAGMIGSTRGWHDAPYVDAPASLALLAEHAVRLDAGVTIVPGVALRAPHRADVMRGEEVQALGAVTAGLVPGDALLCQPGTHNKWIELSDGRIARFATTMTGELFALLRAHGILAGMLDGTVRDGTPFRAGLARGAGARDLSSALFEVRARVLLGVRAADDAAAFASGILIGADVGARDDVAGRDVYLLASGGLADLYASAIAFVGARAVPVDSDAAFLAGMHAIWELSA